MQRALSLKATVAGIILAAGASSPAWSAGNPLVLLQKGKPVTAVPVDQLSTLTVSLQAPGPSFKKQFAGQWGGIDQTVCVVAIPFDRSAGAPPLSESHLWNGHTLGLTSSDAGWGAKKALSAPMNQAARELRLFEADTSQAIVMTARFRRQVYTGKLLWQNNGWVKETRWETVGPTLGQAVLRLEPPASAKQLVLNDLLPQATGLNDRAKSTAIELLYPYSYSGRTNVFDESRIVGLEPAAGKAPRYNWNYNGNSEWVFAKIPVMTKIRTVMVTTFSENPASPVRTEADFLCPADISAKCPVGGTTWQLDDLELASHLRDNCRTVDNRTADDVIKDVKAPSAMPNRRGGNELQNMFQRIIR